MNPEPVNSEALYLALSAKGVKALASSNKDVPLNKDEKLLLERLYKTYRPLMIYIAARIIPDSMLVDDAVSEAFTKIIQYREKFMSMECHQEKGYIVSIIGSVSINIKKKRERVARESNELNEDIVDLNVNILDEVTANDGYDSIVLAVLSLPDKMRDVAYYYYSHGMTHEEIANKLDITINASKKRLERAKTIIRAKLGGDFNA